MRPSRMLGAALAAALGLAASLSAMSVSLAGEQEPRFPHESHAGLFPVCTGCHAGVEEDPVAAYPDSATCAGCHDGAGLPIVEWIGPERVPGSLSFDHGDHAAQLSLQGVPPPSCESCHSAGDVRMRIVERAEVETCFSCHRGDPAEHLTAAACEVCHVPLASTRLPAARIATLPVPVDHLHGAFLAEHGSGAAAQVGRCATCHTAERCLACHVDVDNSSIALVPAAHPELDLPPMSAAYPVPEDHRRPDWTTTGHLAAASERTCVTCHTRDDCSACHVEPAPRAATRLPAAADVAAPGARVRAAAPESHGRPFFMDAHGALAAADETCRTCHTPSYCVDCHDAPAGASHHPPDFAIAHSAVAFGRQDECASCHDTAVFCRSCHIESGLATRGALGAGYHDAEPLWLLRHGQAARQSLESCASCHEQRDCVQCHGALGSFGVSPHGPGFDAAEAWARSPRTCLACHVGNPLRSGP